MTATSALAVPPDHYRGLASVYDEWQEGFGPFWRLALPRLLATLERHALPELTPSLVDLGCGTGSLLLSLRRTHPRWALTGLDASAAMIDAARRRPHAETVRWLRASFDQPWSDEPSHTVAVSFFDALNHASAPGALARTFQATARGLAPGGLFVFDLNNRDGFEAWWQGRRVYHGPRWTLTMDARFDARAGLAQGRAVVSRKNAGEVVTEVTERCFEEDEVRAALTDAAFAIERCEPWRPLPADVPGKTWWVARLGQRPRTEVPLALRSILTAE